MEAKLVLEDGAVFIGKSFGAEIETAGEVVFTTAMTGYPEAFTDPSYFGQILVMTYPLIGNYGVPDKTNFQSGKMQISGLAVTVNCENPSHYQNVKTLSSWLKENKVPAIEGIDTRALTQLLRSKGTMLGKIILDKNKIDFYDPNKENLVAKVSVSKPKIFRKNGSKKTVCLLDCGYKRAILENLLKRGLTVWLTPWDFDPFGKLSFDGMVISNGPGDPKVVKKTIAIVRKAIKNKTPVLGICFGSQILSLAAGADTYKLKFGHRSLNQPVKDLNSNKCFITSQNHGFAVNLKSLPSGFKEWFINLNDGTCEGVISSDGKMMGVQFHPEGCPGPTDTGWIFDEFVDNLKINRLRP